MTEPVCPAGHSTEHLDRGSELMLRLIARRNRLLGTWAAERMHLSPAESEAYARSVIQAEFENAGDDDAVRRVLGDLLMAGVEADETDVHAALRQCEAEARRTFLGPA